MISTKQQHDIAQLLRTEYERLGTWDKVANRVGASNATVSHNMQDPDLWGLVAPRMWAKVAAKLGYVLTNSEWRLVETKNSQLMAKTLSDAQQQAMFLAIAHPAGQGKSTGARLYAERDVNKSVFYLEVKEAWSHKEFMRRLAQVCGIKVERQNVAELLDAIVLFLKARTAKIRPLLIIDEAANLKPMSLRIIKPLYNDLQDQIGLVIIGTDDLKKKIRSGVNRNAQGFDELESRLGRTYQRLLGVHREDVLAICRANGVTDPAAIDEIWQKMAPRSADFAGEDLRRLRRLIEREQLNGRKKRQIDLEFDGAYVTAGRA